MINRRENPPRGNDEQGNKGWWLRERMVNEHVTLDSEPAQPNPFFDLTQELESFHKRESVVRAHCPGTLANQKRKLGVRAQDRHLWALNLLTSSVECCTEHNYRFCHSAQSYTFLWTL